MDLETTLLAVQTERTQLLDAALSQQLQDIRAKNDNVAQLNDDLVALMRQRAELERRNTPSSSAQLARLDNKINSVKQEIAALTAPKPEEIAMRQKIATLTALWDVSSWAGRNMVVRAVHQYRQPLEYRLQQLQAKYRQRRRADDVPGHARRDSPARCRRARAAV